MLADRLSLGRQFEESIATISVSIDDAELHRLCELLRVAYAEGELAKLVWDRNRKNDARYFSVGHEYMVIACSDRSALAEAKVKFREPKDGIEEARELFARLRRSHKDNWDVIRSKWLAWFETIPVSDPKRRMMRYTKVNERGPYRDDGNINWPGGGGPRYEVLHPKTQKPCRIPNSGWRYPTAERFWEMHGEGKIAFGPDEATVPATISYLFESDDQVMHSVHYSYAQTAAQEFDAIFGKRVFDNPKNWRDIKRLCSYLSADDSLVLDYFAGSGTTAHAVINLNRDTGSKRKFLLAEMGGYFDSVLKPRITKILYSPDWHNGTCLNHQLGVSAVVKYFALESYEDALNNLPSPTDQLLRGLDESTWNTLVQYSLDVELGPRILRMEWFTDPWGCKLYAQPAGKPSATIHNVDMVETFNYLIGLKVQSYGPIERYSADFVRLPHGDDKDAKGNPLPVDKREGRLRVEGRLRRDAEGPFVYQRIEGELNDGNATRVLVIWRKLTDDAEKDAAVLEAWMARHRENTKERSDYREYHLIYLNGPITLPQPTQELRTVLPTEQTFKDRMFEDTEV